MGIHYDSLNSKIRQCMTQELERDITSGSFYTSSRLTDEGANDWPNILRDAFREHDDAWIASCLRSRNLLRTHERRRKPKGGFTDAKVPHTAADTLAEGEFNRFYARGLCVDLLNSHEDAEVEVYRGKEVQNPRRESEDMIGQRLSARQLLEDLRSSQGVEPALGLPPGPNSGLTVRRARA